MFLKDLNLIGFGKYDNKTINLKEGINIIYGENESGKTTIHSFIDGMFYGFLRPYVRSTLYLEEHSKYQPWNVNRYSGIIKFYYSGQLYRLEREFTKGKESTKVFIENTGEDITYNIDCGNKGRVLQPGIHFFGFNSNTFTNTVSIKQLGSRTDDKLADDVRDKLINVTTTLDDDISIEKAIKDLDISLKQIGTIKAHTSIYGTTHAKIVKLEEHLQEILQIKDEYENILDEDRALKLELDKLNEQLEYEKYELKRSQYSHKKKIYNDTAKITDYIKNKEDELLELKTYKDLSHEDYSVTITMNNNINIIDSKLDEASNQVNELELDIKKIQDKISTESKDEFEQILADYHNYDNMDEDKNKLLYGKDSSALEFLKRDLDDNKKSINLLNIMIILGFSVYFGLNFIFRKSLSLILLFQLLILPWFILYKKIKEKKQFELRIRNQIEEIKHEGDNRRKKIEEIDLKQQGLLNKYNLSNKVDFRLLYDKVYHKKLNIEEELQSIKEYELKLSNIKAKALSLKDEKLQLEYKLATILSKNLSQDLDEFRKNISKKDDYFDISGDVENKTELIKRILGNLNMDDLKTYLKDNIDLNSDDIKPIDEINENIDCIQNEITNTSLTKKGLEERLQILAPQVWTLADVKEELFRSKALIENLDQKRKSIELAKSTIEDISKDIHNQFAPEINKKVGSIIAEITDGKYSQVRINSNLELSVIDNLSRELIDINNLSGGTIDQIYFSLRFGVVNSMSGDNLPLILDDCFIQYDDIRLGNILRFLVDVSKERQIILFSCQNRERDILENMSIDFNLITLD